MPQLKLRTMFLIVTIVALFFGYIVNYTEQNATCLLMISGPGPGGTGKAIDTTTDLTASQQFISAVIEEPGVSDLAVFQDQQDPKEWLQERLEINPCQPGSEVLRIELIRYPYLDADDEAEDYPLILDAVIHVLQRKVGSDVNTQVFQRPTLPM